MNIADLYSYLESLRRGTQGLLANPADTLNQWGSQIKEDLAAYNQNNATTMGLLGAGQPDAAGQMAWQNNGGLGTNLGLLGLHIAYHGTPHTVDKFDMSKVGTGEGAQAYGHGLYFAENPATAQAYRNILAGEQLKMSNGDVLPANMSYGGTTQDHAAQYIAMQRKIGSADPITDAQKYVFGDLQSGLSKGMNDPDYIASRQKIIDQLQQWKDAGVQPIKGGAVYKVDINADPAHYLDWDKPLSQQSPKVQAAANATFAKNLRTREIGPGLTDVYLYPGGGGSLGVFTPENLPGVLANPAASMPMTGADFYQSVAGMGTGTNRAPAVSDQLRQLGIPGIKYKDAGSRGTDSGTHNYVVFDDSLINNLGPQP